MESLVEFKVGDKVRFSAKRGNPTGDLPTDGTFTIGAVIPLQDPNGYYVDPYYWDCGWEWAREKTRLDVAGHPQVVFLEGVPEYNTGFPDYSHADPDNKKRRSFSGFYFEKV